MKEEREESNAKKMLVAVGLITILVGTTVNMWRGVSHINEQKIVAEYDATVVEAVKEIESWMKRYIDVLYGGKALFAASETVTRDEWKRYIRTLDIEKRFPGLHAVEFIERVPHSNLDAFIQRIQEETENPIFDIYPKSVTEEHHIVNYIEPLAGNEAAFGFDLSSNEERKTALQESAETGEAVLTAPISLVQGEQKNIGFLTMLPVYEEEKSGAAGKTVNGFALAVFDAQELFGALTQEISELKYIALDVRDKESNQVLWQTTDPNTIEDDRFVTTRVLSIAGREWIMQLRKKHSFQQAFIERVTPNNVLASGGLITIIAVMLLYFYYQSKARAKYLATKLTKHLKEEQQKTKELAERLELATRSGDIGVWEWDVKKDILMWDEQMYKIYGVKKEEFRGAYEAWEQGVHPEDKATAAQAVEDAITKGKKFDTTFRVIWPNGIVRDIKAYAIVQKDEEGEAAKMIGVNMDITQAKEIDRAKTEFVSLASHQLRTPLSAISWYAEMLINGDAGKLNQEQQEYTEEIYTGNQRMIRLVNDLLNVSRIELGTFLSNPEHVSIKEVIDCVYGELQNQIKEKKIVYTVTYTDSVKSLWIDKKLIIMICENLLSNAVKYTPEGGTVTLDIADVGTKIRIEITDTGYGIPKNQQEKIFTKLFRADNVKEKDTQGTGLGLYMVKSIIDQLDGSITFISEKGKGTTFTVVLNKEGDNEKGYA